MDATQTTSHCETICVPKRRLKLTRTAEKPVEEVETEAKWTCVICTLAVEPMMAVPCGHSICRKCSHKEPLVCCICRDPIREWIPNYDLATAIGASFDVEKERANKKNIPPIEDIQEQTHELLHRYWNKCGHLASVYALFLRHKMEEQEKQPKLSLIWIITYTYAEFEKFAASYYQDPIDALWRYNMAILFDRYLAVADLKRCKTLHSCLGEDTYKVEMEPGFPKAMIRVTRRRPLVYDEDDPDHDHYEIIDEPTY
jgi:hypothetical protein